MDASMNEEFLSPGASAFAEATTLNVPTAKLFPRAWSPQLDVFVLITRIAERNHLVLHAMREGAVWDVELEGDAVPHPGITSICWSPDALIIVVGHAGDKLSFHSLHDGRILRTLPLNAPGTEITEERSIRDMWWLKHELRERSEAFKDVFNRKEVPGTAHSLLSQLPLIDTVQRNAPQLKSETIPYGTRRPGQTAPMPTPPDRDPSLIPSLIEDPYAATIAPPPLPSSENTAGRRPTHEQYLDSQKSNSDSLLVVADSTGHLHFFMDGYYSLGSHYLGISCNPVSVYAPPTPSYDPNTEAAPDAQLYVFATRYSTLFNPTPSAHPTSEDLNPDTLIPNPFGQVTSTSAASLRFPLLHAPWTRALARQSTTIRALLIYSSAVVKEMRDGWMGTPTREGARGLGAKWVAHLEQMQAAHGDSSGSDGLYHLVTLLLTGRSPHSVREFFSSGGRLSERALSQWEGTMTRALAVLQEYSERKLVPAFERILILLEEVLGWSMWTQRYKAFQLQEAEISAAIKQVLKTIEYTEWLAKAAEDELLRYGEFLRWFRSESLRANDGSNNELRPINYDPLEVLTYLETGFVSSPLDRWFNGDTPPLLAPSDVIIRPFKNVNSAIETARSFLSKKLPEDRVSTWPSMPAAASADESSRMDVSEDVEGSRLSETSVTEGDLDLADTEREAALEKITERNIVLLVEDVIQRCQGIFIPASGTVVRRIDAKTGPLVKALQMTVPPAGPREGLTVCRERLVAEEGHTTLYVALTEAPAAPATEVTEMEMGVAPKQQQHVYFLRIEFSDWKLDAAPLAVLGAVLDYGGGESPLEGSDLPVDLLDFAFFDDETSVLLLRTEGIGYLVQVLHSGLQFHTIAHTNSDALGCREMWASRLREAVRRGEVRAQDLASLAQVSNEQRAGVRAHALNVCRDGGGGVLAVNGIARREVVCVLDEYGRGQVFDLSQDAGEEEDESEGAE